MASLGIWTLEGDISLGTAVDTVVPVARGQVRRVVSTGLAFLVLAPHGGAWRAMILTGPMRTDTAKLPREWLEHRTKVVEP
jgi:hypothetical protein